MMANAQVLAVIDVARSQIGVREYPSGSNNVKYNTWFYGRPVSGERYSWCATFLDWIFEQAGCGRLYPHNANAAYGQDDVVRKCGGKWILKQNTDLKKRKEYTRTKAQPGDIVDLNFNRVSEYRQHTGILEKVDGDYLVTIEGNTSSGSGSQSNGGMVARKRRHYKYLVSASRPAWSGQQVAKPSNTNASGKKPRKTETKKQVIPSYVSGKTYTTAVDCLNVRTGPGTNFRAKKKLELTKDGKKHANASGQLRKGTNVTCLAVRINSGNVWMKIPSGWICAYNGKKKYVK